ncbi:DUF3558 family protein [Actinokineospora guangxiensis]|uniref:DUF3558 family protein n=1 Tax=Actinokineospora guangxiensis TaxID=1490288 RepID=A0ABW0ET49_9PSEU
MKRGIVLLVFVCAAGCGTNVDTPPLPMTTSTAATTVTTPPEISESVAVEPLLKDPCAAVSMSTLRDLGVPLVPARIEVDAAVGCRWEEGSVGTGLGVIVHPGHDPLEGVFDRSGVQQIDVAGFPALRLGVKPESLCQVWVKTAPDQGISVNYRSFDRPIDACGGATAVASEVAGALRR